MPFGAIACKASCDWQSFFMPSLAVQSVFYAPTYLLPRGLHFDVQGDLSNGMELVFEMTGWTFDKDGEKATDFGVCKALGVEFNFNRTEHKILEVCNTQARKEALLRQLEDAINAGLLDKQQSLILRGRLGFADSFLHGRSSW